jgi:cytochrome c oxidase assembly protein subunit 15
VLNETANYRRNQPVIIWLLAAAFMIVLMVAIGGITRLTNSGLSIVEWKPITGAIPPLSVSDWQAEFTKYQQSPEFKQINFNMDLKEFKFIYMLEYVHRLAGRITGIVFLIPFLFFIKRKTLDTSTIKSLGVIFLLGILQGFIGWYMVKSGLSNHPDVSHYRLSLHLTTAFIIFGLILWQAFNLINKGKDDCPSLPKMIIVQAWLIICYILLQVVYGGLVAGLDAGLIYNTFPLMEGEILPKEALSLKPWYLNLVENRAMVQFIHRILALLVTVNITVFYIKGIIIKLPRKLQIAMNLLLIVLIIQVSLGIITLIKNVPIAFASLHQIVAMLLFGIFIFIVNQFHHAAGK